MKADDITDFYLETIVRLGMYSNKKNLLFHMETIFKEIVLENRRILDIGGGSGIYSFYAACRGAKEVICLEPEADGSTVGVNDIFNKLGNILNMKNVKLERTWIQDYTMDIDKFDVIFIANSINHLDESSCITLLENKHSRLSYQNIFKRLHNLSNNGARLVITDCSRYNFFNLFGLRNPFVPTIEWHKHQSPVTWATLLSDAGFINPVVNWPSFNTLGNLGRILTGNKFMAYFLTSNFRLTMDKNR